MTETPRPAERVWWLSAHPGSGTSGPYTETEAAELWDRGGPGWTEPSAWRTTPDGTSRERVDPPPWAGLRPR